MDESREVWFVESNSGRGGGGGGGGGGSGGAAGADGDGLETGGKELDTIAADTEGSGGGGENDGGVDDVTRGGDV